MFKEKSGAALEAAKASNAGKTIAGGLSNAATAGQEKYGKLKGTDAFKKSSTMASDAYERTSLVASGALEKVGIDLCVVYMWVVVVAQALLFVVGTRLMCVITCSFCILSTGRHVLRRRLGWRWQSTLLLLVLRRSSRRQAARRAARIRAAVGWVVSSVSRP